MFQLSVVDLFIIGFYFVFVLGVGYYLKRFTTSGDDFFLAGRNQTAWIAGISFITANMGALELMGWSAAAYQYGMLAVHWYWIGAIPAILFLGIFMMPFDHVSRTHSVPGYLKLRFGEPAHVLSAVTFGVMTLLASGISMYSMGVSAICGRGPEDPVSAWSVRTAADRARGICCPAAIRSVTAGSPQRSSPSMAAVLSDCVREGGVIRTTSCPGPRGAGRGEGSGPLDSGGSNGPG